MKLSRQRNLIQQSEATFRKSSRKKRFLKRAEKSKKSKKRKKRNKYNKNRKKKLTKINYHKKDKHRFSQYGSGKIIRRASTMAMIPVAGTVMGVNMMIEKLKKKLRKSIDIDVSETSQIDIDINIELESIRQINNSNIEQNNTRILGQGKFGSVSIGEYKDPTCNLPSFVVAIKKLKTTNDNNLNALLKEAVILKRASESYNQNTIVYNPYCVQLVGLLSEGIYISIISEYCEYGSLLDFIREECHGNITSYGVIKWAQDISKGMDFIYKRGIIHRDLAARNILINSLYTAKISDFGLSFVKKGVNEDDITSKNYIIPVRWSSPHVLQKLSSSSSDSQKMSNVWDNKSDIWSYGIILYELLSRGSRPFNDIEDTKIQAHIMEHQYPSIKLRDKECILIEAENGGNLLYNIWNEIAIKLCFHDDSVLSFERIVNALDIIYKSPNSSRLFKVLNNHHLIKGEKGKQYNIYGNCAYKNRDGRVYHFYEYSDVDKKFKKNETTEKVDFITKIIDGRKVTLL